MPADYLELELTETALLENLEATIGQQEQPKALGIPIAIDDFGTGYSSLSYLRRLQIDILKVDRSFVSEIDKGSEGAAIVESIVSLGHNLGLSIVAEGVETDAQLERLSEFGCDEMQGFHLSMPLAPAELDVFLRNHADTPLLGRRETEPVPMLVAEGGGA